MSRARSSNLWGRIAVLFVVLVGSVSASEPAVSNLIAHWDFDEGEGDMAYDSAGNNHGVVHGGAEWTTGQVGGALSFDGVDDYVDLGDTVKGDLETSYTVAAWIKPNAVSSDYIVASYRHSGDSRPVLFQLQQQFSNVLFTVKDDSGNDAVASWSDAVGPENWYHLAGVREGNTVNVYVNGVKGTSDTAPLGTISPDNLKIGALQCCGIPLFQLFDGEIDEVRIYDRALSADQVQQLYRETTGGLVAHWDFDEGEGDIAYDSVGNNHGVVQGAEWTAGQVGGALSFDGVDDFVELHDDSFDSLGDNVTFSAWINRDRTDAPQHETIVGYADEDGYNNFFFLMIDFENRLSYNVRRSSSRDDCGYFGATPLESGRWYHVAVAATDSSVVGYINGVPEVFTRHPESDCPRVYGIPDVSAQAENASIGNLNRRVPYQCDYFMGKIDDVRIYDRALSAAEIQELAGVQQPEQQTYHVDTVNGNDNNDGLTPETAFATIQKGIDEAEDGFTVLVYPGVYTEETVFKGKAITVQSAADAAVLEAPGDNAVSFYYGEEPNSVLKNFVITNSNRAIFIAGSSPTISNVTVVDNDFGIEAYAGSEPDISNCIFWNNTKIDLFQCQARYSCIQKGNADGGNIHADPCFADANNGDYHLFSERGRYVSVYGLWDLDDATSPCVDAGDPTGDYSNERTPNGGRINMGAYGGTAYASMSECWTKADINCDGKVDMLDFALMAAHWLEDNTAPTYHPGPTTDEFP